MKKLLAMLIAAALLLSACTAGNAVTELKSGDFTVRSYGDGTCAIIKYNGDDKFLDIPEKLNDELVTAIGTENGGGAFSGNKTLAALTIPSTVHAIYADSFRGCTALSVLFIPETVVYVGKDAFAGCTALTSLSCGAQCEGEWRWDDGWNSGNIPVIWGDEAGNGGGGTAAVDIVETIGKGLLSSITGKIEDMGINTALSYFGYKSPEAKFTERSLDDIKKAITNQTTNMAIQMDNIEFKLNDMRDQLDAVQRTVIATTDRGELGSRMTTINRDIAKIDTLYSGYLVALIPGYYDMGVIEAKEEVEKIAAADLPTIITYISSELTHSGAGSQTPLLTLYQGYLNNVLPFEWQVTGKAYLYQEYMQGELLKATQLYTEYCNYEQAVYDGDTAQQKVWQQRSQNAIKTYNDSVREQLALMPDKSTANLHPTGDEHVFHIVNRKFNVDMYFDNRPIGWGAFCFHEDADFGPDWNYSEGTVSGGVTRDDYRNLNKLRILYDKNISNRDFIKKNTGAEIPAVNWGVSGNRVEDRGNWYGEYPALDINDVEKMWVSMGDAIHVWKK